MSEFFLNFLAFFNESNWWIPSLFTIAIIGGFFKGIADSVDDAVCSLQSTEPLFGSENWHLFTNLQDILNSLIGVSITMRVMTFEDYTGIAFILDIISVLFLRWVVFGFVYRVNKTRTIRAYYDPLQNTKKFYYPKFVDGAIHEGYIATNKWQTIILDLCLIGFLVLRYIIR